MRQGRRGRRKRRKSGGATSQRQRFPLHLLFLPLSPHLSNGEEEEDEDGSTLILPPSWAKAAAAL